MSFYGYDGHGSVRQLTNVGGAVTDVYEYDAFGNLLNWGGSTANSYLFGGEQFDSDLDLYYLRARWFNQKTGRFVTADKYEGITEDPTTLQRYVYAHGDPINFVDPSGFDAEEVGLLTLVQNGVKAALASQSGLALYGLCRAYTAFRLIGSIVTGSSFGSLGLPVDIGCGIITFGPWVINVSTPSVVATLQGFITLAEGELPVRYLLF